MNIYAVHNGTGSRYYRLVPQLKHMQERGHKVILEGVEDQHTEDHIAWADVVIWEMVLDPTRLKLAKKLGKKVIFECDDLIHIVPPTHYAYKSTKGVKNRLRWWKKMYPIFSKMDGFIATTDKLTHKYGRFAKKSLVFPNYLDLSHWLKEHKPNQSDEVRLLWAGSTSHTGDLQMIKPTIDKVLRKYPQVKFIYIGTGGIRTKDLNSQFIYGEDIWEGLPDNRESMLPMVGGLWPYTLASLLADVAIAPLEHNYFNGFKSTCKALEYSVNKIPAVYSAWHYQPTIVNGLNGYLATTEDDWLTALGRLIEDKEHRQKMGEEAYKFALRHHDIRNHLHEWQDFVESIYETDNPTTKEPGQVQV